MVIFVGMYHREWWVNSYPINTAFFGLSYSLKHADMHACAHVHTHLHLNSVAIFMVRTTETNKSQDSLKKTLMDMKRKEYTLILFLSTFDWTQIWDIISVIICLSHLLVTSFPFCILPFRFLSMRNCMTSEPDKARKTVYDFWFCLSENNNNNHQTITATI